MVMRVHKQFKEKKNRSNSERLQVPAIIIDNTQNRSVEFASPSVVAIPELVASRAARFL